MTTGAADPVFVDTNVLVYAATLSSPLHTEARNALKEREESGVTLCLSRQVLREYLAVMTRPQGQSSPLPISVAISDVERFQSRFRMLEDSPEVTRLPLQLIAPIRIGGKRIHDANIIATVLAYGVTHLLTENRADFKSFHGFVTVSSVGSR